MTQLLTIQAEAKNLMGFEGEIFSLEILVQLFFHEPYSVSQIWKRDMFQIGHSSCNIAVAWRMSKAHQKTWIWNPSAYIHR